MTHALYYTIITMSRKTGSSSCAVAVLLLTSVAPATIMEIIRFMIQGSKVFKDLSSLPNHTDNSVNWNVVSNLLNKYIGTSEYKS